MNKKSTEQFIKKVFELIGDEYEVVGTYVNANTPIEMRHNKCGFKFFVTPSKFLSGYRCPNDAVKRDRTHKDFAEEVHTLVGDEYEILDTYINSMTKIHMKHKCGNIFAVIPKDFLNGKRCPKCSPKTKKDENR